MGCVLDICRSISDLFAVDAGEYDLVVCHLCGNTFGDVGVPGFLLAKEIGNLKPVSLQLELDREVAIDDLHPVLKSFRDAPAHVLCMCLKRPDHRGGLLTVGLSCDDNFLAVAGYRHLREPDAARQLAFGSCHQNLRSLKIHLDAFGNSDFSYACHNSHPLVDIPEQLAADAFLACLHMRHDAMRGGK